MKTLWIVLISILVFSLGLFVVVSCGDDDDDDDYDEDDNDDDDNDDDDNDDDDDDDDDSSDDDDDDDDDSSSGMWTDPNTGLVWQTVSDCCYDWQGAGSYCGLLRLGGNKDWRLPTISELRSLIYGCVNTESNGSCNVSDYCLFPACMNDSCLGCDEDCGPTNGCYWPNQLTGDCLAYWSFSIIPGHSSTYPWSIDFSTALIGHSSTYENYNVRCVR